MPRKIKELMAESLSCGVTPREVMRAPHPLYASPSKGNEGLMVPMTAPLAAHLDKAIFPMNCAMSGGGPLTPFGLPCVPARLRRRCPLSSRRRQPWESRGGQRWG